MQEPGLHPLDPRLECLAPGHQRPGGEVAADTHPPEPACLVSEPFSLLYDVVVVREHLTPGRIEPVDRAIAPAAPRHLELPDRFPGLHKVQECRLPPDGRLGAGTVRGSWSDPAQVRMTRHGFVRWRSVCEPQHLT